MVVEVVPLPPVEVATHDIGDGEDDVDSDDDDDDE